LASNRLDQAKEMFEQIAGNRAWRGEATAQSIYSLGEILLKRGGADDLAQAQAHFQRVYISYKKFTPWVAKAYLSSGQTFERLGQTVEALQTYREMLRDERLSSFPETARARERIAVLELQVPASALSAAPGGAS
jgi:TolA-binding protein